jgi:hypothetical protein
VAYGQDLEAAARGESLGAHTCDRDQTLGALIDVRV